VRTITVGERRARLARRHHLAAEARAADVVEVATDLVGLHSTDPASVYLAARARCVDDAGDVPAVERALYDERMVVRMLGMRRTMFVEPVDLVPVVHAACTRDIAVKERRKLITFIEEGGTAADGEGWLSRVERATLEALSSRGEALAAEMSADVPELGEKIVVGRGTKWETTVGASSRVLFLLAAAGHLVRSRPRGSWISSQYRWAPVEKWFSGGVDDLDTAPARVELVRRWLAAFGPGTVADIKWWTGWTMGEVRKALGAVDPVEVDLGGATGLVLPDDVSASLSPAESAESAEPAPAPWVALLPALDPTLMGWTDRSWYLGDHRPALFDRSGNPGPTVWCDGRVVGGWAQRPGGEVVFRLLEDVGRSAAEAIETEADRLTAWFGGVRVTPRFRTPLERELSSS
jgi:winged helix DNA-binding protein